MTDFDPISDPSELRADAVAARAREQELHASGDHGAADFEGRRAAELEARAASAERLARYRGLQVKLRAEEGPHPCRLHCPRCRAVAGLRVKLDAAFAALSGAEAAELLRLALAEVRP